MMRHLVALVLLLFLADAFVPQHLINSKRQPTLLQQSVVSNLIQSAGNSAENDNGSSNTIFSTRRPHLVFPGGGLFFYWQAGVVSYLREQGYDLTEISASGASAGALTATLTSTGVDFYQATELALQMSKEAGIWDRSSGLQGIWGPIIYDWLDELLPDNALDLVNDGRLSLLVTPVPQFGKDRISEFKSRRDLIECNMASVHLPWFLDGKWTSPFRGRPHIDGSFLANAKDYLPPYNNKPRSIIRLDWGKDPALQDGEFFDFVKVISPDGIWGILEQGKAYAKMMEEKGYFSHLYKT